MEINLRILRSRVADCDPAPPTLSARQQTCLRRIRVVSQTLLAEFGFANLTFTLLAQALRLYPATLRFHFADLHALLGELLRDHLQSLAKAIGHVDPTDPDRHQKRRAAWLDYTRTPTGAFTELHLLLVRDRHLLPEDELQGIELTYRTLGEAVAGNLATVALALLDNPTLTPAEIEERLTPTPTPAVAWVQPTSPAPTPTPVAPCIAAETHIPAKTAEPTPNHTTPEPTPTPPGEWIWTAGIPGVTRPPGDTPPHHSNPLLPPPDDDP